MKPKLSAVFLLTISLLISLTVFSGCASVQKSADEKNDETVIQNISDAQGNPEIQKTNTAEKNNTDSDSAATENSEIPAEKIKDKSADKISSAGTANTTDSDKAIGVKKNTDKSNDAKTSTDKTNALKPNTGKTPLIKPADKEETLSVLFAGDIMAHNINYRVSDFSKIWNDVKGEIQKADLALANIEAPVDQTKSVSSYPDFNMSKKFVQAAIDAGFDAFSLSNNHTNDQLANGILETVRTTEELSKEVESSGSRIYFSGISPTPRSDSKADNFSNFTFNIIEKNGWKVLFLAMTELLNRPTASSYINFVRPDENTRKAFIKYCKKLRKDNSCDLFIISIHTSEPEYTRKIEPRQDKYYMELLEAGADVIWANHAHIIKDRKFIFNRKSGYEKMIMYANGNTISGQRTKPALDSKRPDGERDNTGDGLFYTVTFKKADNGGIQIQDAQPYYITTYINTAGEFLIKPLDESFVEYLNGVSRHNWADYIKRRIRINEEETKDLILWQN